MPFDGHSKVLGRNIHFRVAMWKKKSRPQENRRKTWQISNRKMTGNFASFHFIPLAFQFLLVIVCIWSQKNTFCIGFSVIKFGLMLPGGYGEGAQESI